MFPRTRSNLPPSAKEEAAIRALLKQKNEETTIINEIILKSETSIVSSKNSIDKLVQARNTAREMLSGYQKHTEACKRSLESFNNRFSLASDGAPGENPESWEAVQM